MPDISADLISGRRFAQTWRGYDPEEVKEFLAQVAEQVRTLRERLDIEVSARREADQRALHPRIDEATLMSAVGEETAAILRSARTAAAEIIAKAEANAESRVAAAEAKSGELLAHSEALSTRRVEESEVAANEVWAKALADAEELRRSAQQDATAVAEEAAQKGQDSIEAAEVVREKVLTDLARRRKLATVQIEQLRAGRERLLDAYLVVRRTLDEVTNELQRADAEARAAAVAVGRMDRDEHTGELLDLRREDHWDSLAAFGGAEPVGHAGDQRTTAETPVVLAPKVTQVAQAPAVVVAPPPPKMVSEDLAGGRQYRCRLAGRRHRECPDRAHRTKRHGPYGRRGARRGHPAPESASNDGRSATQRTYSQPPTPGAPTAITAGTEEAEGEAGQGKDVQGLFARLRENRDQATRAARKTLRDTGSQDGVDTGMDEVEATQNGAGQVTVEDATLEAQPEAAGNGALTAVSEEEQEGAAAGAAGVGVDAGEKLLERGATVTRDLGSSLTRKLKRALQDEQNSLLDRLRSLKGPVTPASVLPDADEHPDHFADAGRPLLQQAAQAGAQVASELCGSDAANVAVAQHVDDLAEELGRAIAEPLRQRLELAMRSAGDDQAEVANALGAAYREWKTQRIEASAHHEVAAAFSRGAYLTFPEGGLLRWVVGSAEGPCPDCEDNALAGEQPKGEAWPTGQLYPPAHPGCRCAVAPAGGDGTGTATT